MILLVDSVSDDILQMVLGSDLLRKVGGLQELLVPHGRLRAPNKFTAVEKYRFTHTSIPCFTGCYNFILFTFLDDQELVTFF